MTKTDAVKLGSIFLSGFLTLIMQSFVPIGGGGISLIFVLTVPLAIEISILSSMLFYRFSRKHKDTAKNSTFFLCVLLNGLISVGMYPYASWINAPHPILNQMFKYKYILLIKLILQIGFIFLLIIGIPLLTDIFMFIFREIWGKQTTLQEKTPYYKQPILFGTALLLSFCILSVIFFIFESSFRSISLLYR